ncbi:hypothetical protein [Lonsdalea quercina]|uniref:hypothetical protein n=1 Tax=Lonsdalea quercina TaxID=71657 RepID=UPI003975A3D0
MKISFPWRVARLHLFDVSVLVGEPEGEGRDAWSGGNDKVGLTGTVEARLAKTRARHGAEESQPLAKR